MKKTLALLLIFLRIIICSAGCMAPHGSLPTETSETEASTTIAPTTAAPATEAPTTTAPVTEAPTTEDPTTEAPTTEPPTTTEPPSTEPPETEPPETEPPETAEPPTEDDGLPYASREEITLDPSWLYADFSVIHTGAAVFYHAKHPNGIVIGVNAGHGTKGGGRQKVYCHPDKSPKLTGGTTEKGAIQGVAVSTGMTFLDGAEEHAVTLQAAILLRDKLLRAGYDVLMIRDGADVQLDNIARTVICNNLADCHISLHWDSDSRDYDKGAFFMSVPDGLKYLPSVGQHWQDTEDLGRCLIDGLRENEVRIFGKGYMAQDLSQTAYSSIPSVIIELGNQCSDHSEAKLQKITDGLMEGIDRFFEDERMSHGR